MDIWGPFHIATRNGEKYFLTIVDEYTKSTWIYLMHSKLDVLQMIKKFVALVHNQFSSSIEIVRTNNATDFFKSECTTFFNFLGITHQSSCPYTPQQNGTLERKHRHIPNVARSLMFQANVSHEYWGDCVLTTCYLINRTPTPLLNSKTPYEMLIKNLLHIPISEFLDASVMHLFCLEPINFLHGLILVFFLVILSLKRATCFSILLHIKYSFIEMFISLNPYFLFVILLLLHLFFYSNQINLMIYCLPIHH